MFTADIYTVITLSTGPDYLATTKNVVYRKDISQNKKLLFLAKNFHIFFILERTF